MADIRWDPFGEMVSLRDAMDGLMRDSFVRSRGSRPGESESFPVELGEQAGGYVVRAYMPGVKPEDIHVSVHGDVLTIRAEQRESQEHQVEHWLMRERRAGTLLRTIRLPAQVEADKAEARSEHGVLVLTLPKAESAKPHRIAVHSSDQPRQVAAGSGEQQPNTANTSAATGAEGSLASQRGETRREDVVTEGSDLSFPASDPPSWNPGHTGASSST